VSIAGAGRELLAMERGDLALRLLLVALLLQPVGDRWLRPLIVGVAAFGLLAPGAVRSTLLWSGLAGLAALRIVLDWPLSDNHAYLLAYWCLAAAIASAAGPERAGVLAWNGRALIGLTFLFATLWKVVLSPDFLDGRFFAVTLVDDERMEDFARLAGGLSEDAFWDLRELVREHADGVFVPWEVMPEQPARFRSLVAVMTAGTVAIEGALAAAFLLPLPPRLLLARHALLLLFCATTYALAPVAGFGWLLLSMGVAQTERGWRRLRVGYLTTFVFVLLVTRWPWLRLLAG
jgi:hypothetical protein